MRFAAAIFGAILCWTGIVALGQDPAAERAANESLCQPLRDLRAHLGTLPDEQRQRWERGLDWTALDGLCAGPRLEAAIAVAKQLYGVEEGLEHPAFAAARLAIEAWVNRQWAVAAPHRRAEATARTGDLRRWIAAPADEVDLDSQEASEHVAWLSALGLEREVCAEARLRFSHPNVILHLDRALFAEQLDEFRQDLQRSRFSANLIAGACVTGQAHVSGQARAELPVDERQARAMILLAGQIQTPANTAVKGKVRVYSSGVTHFTGEKRVYWKDGRVVSDPAEVTARTNANLRGLDSNIFAHAGPLHGWVAELAWRKALKTRPQGECESARLAERQLADELDREVAAKLELANQRVVEFFHSPLARLGVATRVTTAAGARHVAVGFQASNGGLAAPRHPHPRPVLGQIQVNVHESMVGCLSRPSIGGAWWTDLDLALFQKELVGENSPQFRLGPHMPAWAMQFAWRQPLLTKIGQQGVTFVIRGARCRIDDHVCDLPFRVRANFQLRLTNYGIQFLRHGDVVVDSGPSGEDASANLSADAVSAGESRGGGLPAEVRELLRLKFSDLLGEEVYLDGLCPPAGGTFDGLARFESRYLNLQAGWLTLGFDRTDAPISAGDSRLLDASVPTR